MTDMTMATLDEQSAAPCEHRDDFGSTIIFVQDRPQDGICMLCDAYFPALVLVPDAP